MIYDRTALFSENQAITTSGPSTNVIDLAPIGTIYGAGAPVRRDVGKGTVVPLGCRVTAAFNNLTNFSIVIQQADDPAFTVNVETVFASQTYVLADLGPGKRHLLPDSLPVGLNRRYVRLYYVVNGTAPTTGTIYAGVNMGNQTNTNS